MRHVKWSLVVGFVALALGVGAVVQAQQQLSGEYKIGVLEPLTGNLAAEGKRHLEGYELSETWPRHPLLQCGNNRILSYGVAPQPVWLKAAQTGGA